MIETVTFGTMKVLMVVYTILATNPAQPIYRDAQVVSALHCKNMQEMAFMRYEVHNPKDNFTFILCDRFS